MLLWGFEGPAEDAQAFVDEYRMELTALADEDRSLIADYFVTEVDDDAFALYPRHFVIDRDGRFAYIATQYQPDALLAAIDSALAR